jgi:hypothetical protein
VAGEFASFCRFEPHALDPAGVDLMLQRWNRAPDGGRNARLAPPIDPYGAFMRELLEFLGKYHFGPIRTQKKNSSKTVIKTLSPQTHR